MSLLKMYSACATSWKLPTSTLKPVWLWRMLRQLCPLSKKGAIQNFLQIRSIAKFLYLLRYGCTNFRQLSQNEEILNKNLFAS